LFLTHRNQTMSKEEIPPMEFLPGDTVAYEIVGSPHEGIIVGLVQQARLAKHSQTWIYTIYGTNIKVPAHQLTRVETVHTLSLKTKNA
jgi:hypothetical protein